MLSTAPKACVQSVDGTYCYTHLCGVFEKERCGAAGCPHCQVALAEKVMGWHLIDAFFNGFTLACVVTWVIVTGLREPSSWKVEDVFGALVLIGIIGGVLNVRRVKRGKHV